MTNNDFIIGSCVKNNICKLIIMIIFLMPFSVFSQDEIDELSEDDFSEILNALEKDKNELNDSTNNHSDDNTEQDLIFTEQKKSSSSSYQNMNPAISFIADFAAAYFSEDEHLQTGGHDPVNTGFNLQQLEMSVESDVDVYFKLKSNIVFSLFGVEIEEVYGTTLSLPFNLQLRAGQFLTRFGRINNTHPHTWDFVDQPFIIGKFFGSEGNRGLGTEISYLFPLPWFVELIFSATSADGEATARSFYGSENLGVDTPLDLQFVTALKQFFPLSDNLSLFFGLSYASGPNPTGRDNRTEIYGADLYLKYKPITYASYTVIKLQAEYMMRTRQIPLNRLIDHGGFVYLFYKFSKTLAVAARYEYGSPCYDIDLKKTTDTLDTYWSDNRHRISANITYFATEFSRIRLQGSSDILTWEDKQNYAVFLALELAIGAHGAHEF